MNVYFRPGHQYEFGPLIFARNETNDATCWQLVVIIPFTAERWAIQFLLTRAT